MQMLLGFTTLVILDWWEKYLKDMNNLFKVKDNQLKETREPNKD